MFTCPFCGKAWSSGEQCQECGVPRGADPNQSLTEQQLGPVNEIFMLNPVNRGVVMGYSRWAGGKIEQQEASLQLGIMVTLGAVFGFAFISMFICVAITIKAGWLLVLFGTLIFVGMVALVITKVLQVRKNNAINQRFAKAEGTLLPGEITASHVRYIGSSRQHNRHPRVRIEYRFRAPDGQTLTGNGISRFPPPERNLLPPSGTRVAVLYLDGQHHKTL